MTGPGDRPDALREIRAHHDATRSWVVVLDDDPTGCQAMYDATVLIDPTTDELARAAAERRTTFVWTNTRSLPEAAAVEVDRALVQSAVAAAELGGPPGVREPQRLDPARPLRRRGLDGRRHLPSHGPARRRRRVRPGLPRGRPGHRRRRPVGDRGRRRRARGAHRVRARRHVRLPGGGPARLGGRPHVPAAGEDHLHPARRPARPRRRRGREGPPGAARRGRRRRQRRHLRGVPRQRRPRRLPRPVLTTLTAAVRCDDGSGRP